LYVTGTWSLRSAVARVAARCASKVLDRVAQAVAHGAARCVSLVLDRGAQADARGAAHVLDLAAQAVARGATLVLDRVAQADARGAAQVIGRWAGPAHKRTEGSAPVWDYEFTTKAATQQGLQRNSCPVCV